MTAIFVDTGAWFARFVPSDPDHQAVREWLERNRQPLLTTDYVLDELLTLLKVRGEFFRALEVGDAFLSQDVCTLEWVTQADVKAAWRTFSTYLDKDWSFTDCVSRVVIERLQIKTALAFDTHFQQFGTLLVVP